MVNTPWLIKTIRRFWKYTFSLPKIVHILRLNTDINCKLCKQSISWTRSETLKKTLNVIKPFIIIQGNWHWRLPRWHSWRNRSAKCTKGWCVYHFWILQTACYRQQNYSWRLPWYLQMSSWPSRTTGKQFSSSAMFLIRWMQLRNHKKKLFFYIPLRGMK